ncbi:hypothetical protein OSTOST_17604, partial [Ostertagia ostertagi]
MLVAQRWGLALGQAKGNNHGGAFGSDSQSLLHCLCVGFAVFLRGERKSTCDKVELEFQAFRLQQYELNGNVIGSKHFRVQYEAVSLNSKALRRCVVVSWRDLTGRNLDELMETTVGALLIIIPSDLDALSPADKTLFMELEQKLATARTDLAVYVSHSSPEANTILSDVQSASGVSKSATQQLINSIAANTFQGRLSSSERSAPTIAFVAHYDSHAVFPAHDNRLELAICVEAVGSTGPLWMHASKQPADGSAA